MKNTILNQSQHQYAENDFKGKYWELNKDIIDECKILSMEPYITSLKFIEKMNTTRIEDINQVLQKLIKDNLYTSTYMETKEFYYKLFQWLQNHIKNSEVREHIDQYFSVQKYETHVWAFFDKIMNSKK